MHNNLDIRKFAFIGNYLPRQCGIELFVRFQMKTVRIPTMRHIQLMMEKRFCHN